MCPLGTRNGRARGSARRLKEGGRWSGSAVTLTLPWGGPLADTIPPTPLQLTDWLLYTVLLMALAVGVVYVFLLIWTLSRHISHEPLARDRPAPPRRPASSSHPPR